MSACAAWLLDCGGGVFTAVSVANVLHVLDDTSLIQRVPLAPAHCNRLLIWQQQVLPVVDLAQLQTRDAQLSSPINKAFACVLGWRVANDSTDYGVLLTRSLPRQIAIADDSMATPSAAEIALWKNFALSFFNYHGRTVPIVDPATVFGSRSESHDVLAPQRHHL